MFTPSIDYQQAIQNIQAQVHEVITKVKNKIYSSGAVPRKDLETLDKTVEKINSGCEHILLLLSSHDVNKPDSFSQAEKLKLAVLSTNVLESKVFFEVMLSKTFKK